MTDKTCKMNWSRAAAIFSIAAVAVVASVEAMAADNRGNDSPQRYRPVPGGFAIKNGAGKFCRPLYGWHGDDNEKRPLKSMPFASDRPSVALKAFSGSRIGKKPLGVLSFDTGREDVDFRYVYGRAEYDVKGKGVVKMVRSAVSDDLLVEVEGNLSPKITGEWVQAFSCENSGKKYYCFGRKGMRRPSEMDVAKEFVAATDRVERIARTIEIKTPYPILDSLLACQLVAADAIFEGRIICHGVTNWRMPYAGWRGPYICLATAWNDAFKENARLYFKTQRKNGRITCKPGKDNRYNMSEVFVDSVLRYWLWSGDDDFMRECAYEGIKKHLKWMDTHMKVPDADLFENKLNAWNTDNKWCNGGAGTIASSYAAYAYRVMRDVAEKLGKRKDSAYFAKRSQSIENAIAKRLWHEEDGVWGEYRERFGLKRLMRAPDLSSVYTAIDSLPIDAARNRKALRWVEENVPSLITKDGVQFLYSSNRLPLFYSSCGRYQQENIHWALACYQSGETELGWRNLKNIMEISRRGVKSGPGCVFYDLDFDLYPAYGEDFSDSVAIFLRAVVEGVFGIINGREIKPSFPAEWDFAEIKSPYLSYSWTRKDGVRVTKSPKRDASEIKVLPTNKPEWSLAECPKPHERWGKPKGVGTDVSVPPDSKEEFVDFSSVFNQNLRLLHANEYSPLFKNSSVMKNGRTWWEKHEVCGNRRWSKKYCIPAKLNWPSDLVLKTEYGPAFRMGPQEGSNSVFTAFYDQFPSSVEIPLSGKAKKIAFLSAIVTNPNVAWMDAAKISVDYEDGSSEELSLTPPDNCDDWLNYSAGQWKYYNAKRDNRPYAVAGKPVMFGKTAHGNVHAISLNPKKTLKRLRFTCCGTETLAGLLGATLYR